MQARRIICAGENASVGRSGGDSNRGVSLGGGKMNRVSGRFVIVGWLGEGCEMKGAFRKRVLFVESCRVLMALRDRLLVVCCEVGMVSCKSGTRVAVGGGPFGQ